LIEIAEGVEVGKMKKKTDAPFVVLENLKKMEVGLIWSNIMSPYSLQKLSSEASTPSYDPLAFLA